MVAIELRKEENVQVKKHVLTRRSRSNVSLACCFKFSLLCHVVTDEDYVHLK